MYSANKCQKTITDVEADRISTPYTGQGLGLLSKGHYEHDMIWICCRGSWIWGFIQFRKRETSGGTSEGLIHPESTFPYRVSWTSFYWSVDLKEHTHTHTRDEHKVFRVHWVAPPLPPHPNVVRMKGSRAWGWHGRQARRSARRRSISVRHVAERALLAPRATRGISNNDEKGGSQ